MRLFYCTELERAEGLAALGSCHGLGPLDLRAPPALGQVCGSFLPCLIAWLNVVDDVGGARGAGQPRRNTLVLQHGRVSSYGGTSTLDVYLELVFINFRVGKARTNRFFDLGIGLRGVDGRRMRCGYCFLCRGNRFGNLLPQTCACQRSEENGRESSSVNRQDGLPVITLVPDGHGFSQKITRNRSSILASFEEFAGRSHSQTVVRSSPPAT